ncbi:MAG: hypothetical protein ABFS32_08830 [Bacteroidota bacterium]
MDSQFVPIPKDFYAFDTDKPFTNCLVCQRELLTGEVDYFIEKAIRNYKDHEVSDIVYEYAICVHCAQDMNGQMSAESMQNIQDYFGRQPEFLLKVYDHNAKWEELEEISLPDECVITMQPKSDLDEYMIYGHFRGDKMVKSSMPYLLSGQVMDEISDLLSNQTIDQLDGFMGEYFGGPPELEELWKPRRPVFF